MNRTVRTIIVYGVVLVLMVVVAQTWFDTGDKPDEITPSEFVQLVEDGKVESATMFTRSDLLTGELIGAGDKSPDFSFSYPPEWEGTLTDVLVDADIPVVSESDTSIWEVVISL